MIINDLDGYYIVFDTKNWNTELDTLSKYINETSWHSKQEVSFIYYGSLRLFPFSFIYTNLNLSELSTTLTLEKAIRALAHIGVIWKSMPKI